MWNEGGGWRGLSLRGPDGYRGYKSLGSQGSLFAIIRAIRGPSYLFFRGDAKRLHTATQTQSSQEKGAREHNTRQEKTAQGELRPPLLFRFHQRYQANGA